VFLTDLAVRKNANTCVVRAWCLEFLSYPRSQYVYTGCNLI